MSSLEVLNNFILASRDLLVEFTPALSGILYAFVGVIIYKQGRKDK